MLLMTVAALVLTGMHAIVRKLGSELHPFELVFFRNLFGLVAVLPLIARVGASGFRSYQPKIMLVRGVNSVIAMLLWFTALQSVPLAQATALSFLAIVFASIGAAIFLKERMRLRRWTAVAISFCGALIILRPDTGTIAPGLLIVVASALSWGTGVVLIKQLSKTDSTTSIVANFSVTVTALSLPLALTVWKTPSAEQLLWLALIGLLGTLGHLAMTKALSIAETGAVIPLDFTRLIWSALLGYLMFAEIPDYATWTGGLLIVIAATYIIIRESRSNK